MNIQQNGKIFRLRFGKPIETDAVILEPWEPCKKHPFDSNIHIDRTESSVRLEISLNDDDIVLGLGEQLGPLNKRGRRYRAWCVDEPHHNPDKDALYSSHPVIYICGENNLGLFVDYPSQVDFDIGFTRRDLLTIDIPSEAFDLFLWQADSIPDCAAEYIRLTGPSYVPPKWAFGFHQSRWSYPDEKTIREIAGKYREHGIPIDVIHMDIDYMDGYRVFTVSDERFPNLPKLVDELKEQGIRLVAIIDPGVKIDPDYEVYREGVENGYFCTDEDGRPFRVMVWPGWTHLPDFHNEKTRQWWAAHVEKLLESGIEGIWCDMNEPAMFCTDKSLQRIRESLPKLHTPDDLKPQDIFSMRWNCEDIQNYTENFKAMFHRDDNGNRVNHWDIHNLYGYGMIKATSQAIGEDKFLFSRSSYSGMHRISGIWTGDNSSRWEHLLLQIRMIQNLNLCGFLFCGADVGGFNDNVSPELLIRWTQLGVMTPFFRNHSAAGTRVQEPWQFDDETLGILRDTIRFRYALLPYLHSEFLKAAAYGEPLFRSLAYHYDDASLAEFEDQYFIGESLMVAPIHNQNGRGRYVYLPEGNWLMLTVRKWDDFDAEILQEGHHFVEAELDEMLLFVPQDHLIALTEPQMSTQHEVEKITVVGLLATTATLELWREDGESTLQLGEEAQVEGFLQDWEIDFQVFEESE